MAEITKRATFYARNGGVKTMHIETDGAIINITVGLTDADGRAVTRVAILPDDASRGGDGQGRIWQLEHPGRVVRQFEPEDSEATARLRAAAARGQQIRVAADGIPVVWYPRRDQDEQPWTDHVRHYSSDQVQADQPEGTDTPQT